MPTYSGISSDAFRHPLDRQAEETLRSLPGFELLTNRFVEYFYERPQNIYWLGNSIQAGVRQYSTLYGIFRECVRDLDVYPEPNLYVAQNPVANSHALGQEQPYIVVNTEILELMSEVELRTLLAHELGHIKRLSYLEEWANCAEYQQIKQGNYLRVGQRGSIEVESEDTQVEVDDLKS